MLADLYQDGTLGEDQQDNNKPQLDPFRAFPLLFKSCPALVVFAYLLQTTY